MERLWIKGKRFTVMGLGVLGGGVGVAKFLAQHGGIVTVTDLRSADALTNPMRELEGLPITYHLGEHDLADFTPTNADVVVRNPGVPMDSPFLQAAKDTGVAIEMEMSIFFRECPALIIGITGTKGKSTVSALVGAMLDAWNPDSLLAGNMGISAVSQLDRLTLETPVALELSSFQIEALNDNLLSPHVAVLTNISPDHLDRYRDFDHYADTKRGLTHAMAADDIMVFNADDPEVAKLIGQTRARLLPFALVEREGDAAWLDGNMLRVRLGERDLHLPRPDLLALGGNHGALNALAAVSAAVAYGVPEEAIRSGLDGFRGIANRLEEVGRIGGTVFINDTSATAPVAAIANLGLVSSQFDQVHLISGGADKNTDLTGLADAIAESGARVYLLEGTATPRLRELLAERIPETDLPTFDSMESAVIQAYSDISASNAAVLLSPGMASFGMFRNEFDRGQQFRDAVNAIHGESGS